MNDRFVVLGSNSFSGASFVSYLLGLENVEKVVGISRSNELDDAFLPYKNVPGYKSRFSFHKLDLNQEIDEVISLIDGFRPSYIVNFAAQGMVSQSWDNPTHWIQTNVLSLASLLQGIQKFDFIECFIQASTPEVYGASDNMVESHCVSPSTPYAASKVGADALLNAYFKTCGFPVRFTRAANIYGASQQLYRIIPKTILTIMKNEQLPLHGGGKALRSFIHMNDVSRATYLILKNGCNGDIYHISGGETISIRQLVAQICSFMDVALEKVVCDADQRAGSDSKYFLNSEKIKKELNWKPMVSFSDGLTETIEWAKNNFEVLKNLPMEYMHKG